MSSLTIMKFCMLKLQTKIFLELFSEINLSSYKQRYVDSLCYNSLETPCNNNNNNNNNSNNNNNNNNNKHSVSIAKPIHVPYRRPQIFKKMKMFFEVLTAQW